MRFQAAALAALIIAAPAAADDIAGARLAPGSDDQLTIDIRARVRERCGIAAIGSKQSSQLRIDQGQTHTFNFNLDCNTGFRIGVVAGRGALRLSGLSDGTTDLDGFAIERDYSVALNLATDAAANISAGACNSHDLAEGNGTCSFFGHPINGQGFSPGENVTAINRPGSVTVSWDGSDMVEGRRLAAGAYSDTLTVEIGPRV